MHQERPVLDAESHIAEAVMTEPGSKEPVICRVDAVKSSDGIYVPVT